MIALAVQYAIRLHRFQVTENLKQLIVRWIQVQKHQAELILQMTHMGEKQV